MAVTNSKLRNLYEGLSERERVRMQAKLAREHKPDEMNRLRDATPMEHAEAYNRTLKLLRTLNGNTLDWLTIYRVSMERDRFRLQAVVRESAYKWLQHHRLSDVWKLVAYPVTESEYREMVKRQRAEPYPLDEYTQYLAETADTGDALRPELEAAFENLPPELEPVYAERPDPFDLDEWRKYQKTPEHQAALQRETERTEVIAGRLRSLLDAAIKKGELPKPKRKDGEPALPWGILEDWARGTTEETFEPFGPEYFVPALELFRADFAKWDVRPDSETEEVQQRRREILDLFLSLAGVFLALSGISREERSVLQSLDPPKTAAALKRDRKQVEELHHAWYGDTSLAERALDAAMVHAQHRAQLEGLSEALNIIQRDDFYGEDPLFPEIRAQLEAAQEEAARFLEAWESANTGVDLRADLRKLQGLEPYPDDNMSEPAPLPTLEPDTEYMLRLIREWGE